MKSKSGEETTFNWKGAVSQSLLWMMIQDSVRMREPGTRSALKGPFWADYVESVEHLRGWEDGDPFAIEYFWHPIMGSVAGFIEIQNDPKGSRQEFGRSRAYWNSRLKAFAWSAAYSIFFKLCPLGEAGIGNVGQLRSNRSLHPLAYGDMTTSPTMGTGWIIFEDTLDRYLVRRIEQHWSACWVRGSSRVWLNPTRSMANVLRFKTPWRREGERLNLCSGGRSNK